MSLSAGEQQALDSIQGGLGGSDPGPVSLLATFARLASGEEMPVHEEIRVLRRRATRRPLRNRRPRRADVRRDGRSLRLPSGHRQGHGQTRLTRADRHRRAPAPWCRAPGDRGRACAVPGTVRWDT
jgi:hypothetical protein